jgi:hypothetical protein
MRTEKFAKIPVWKKNPQTNKAIIFSYFSLTTVSFFADIKIHASAYNCKDLIFWPCMGLAQHEAT